MNARSPSALLAATMFLIACTGIFPPVRGGELPADGEEYPSPVPDTGQTECYDTQRQIPCPAPGEPFFGQDGNYAINVSLYETVTENGEEVVFDPITGLRWQKVPDPEPRTWHDAIDYTDALHLGGLAGWRLPRKNELQSILSYGLTPTPLKLPPRNKSTDTPLQPARSAWTITTRLFPSLTAKAIDLEDNRGTISDKYEKKFIYAVNGPPLEYGLFTNNGNGTITDARTGLTWQTIEERPMKWEEALRYCEELELGDYTDWRLPTIKELSSLVDEKRIRPAINIDFFPATRSRPYWTGTTFAAHPGFAWYVDFADGLEHNGGYKGRRYLVRAVRGGLVTGVVSEPAPLLEAVPVKTRPVRPVVEEPLVPEIAPAPVPEKKPVLTPAPQPPKPPKPVDMLEPYPLDPEADFE